MPLTVLGEKIRVGLQLYSVRDDAAKDLDGVLGQVSDMGYDAVEFAGFYDHSAAKIRELLTKHGLAACGSHTQFDTLLPDALEQTVTFNQEIGNRYLICPYIKRDTVEEWREVSAFLTDLSETLAPRGLFVGYHNHAHDFHSLDGTTPWDVLYEGAGPNVLMQIDTGNCMDGGSDPVAALRKYPGRSYTVHLKEHSPDGSPRVIGDGDVAWEPFLKECLGSAKTEWYIVEQESYPTTPMESVRQSIENLKTLLP